MDGTGRKKLIRNRRVCSTEAFAGWTAEGAGTESLDRRWDQHSLKVDKLHLQPDRMPVPFQSVAAIRRAGVASKGRTLPHARGPALQEPRSLCRESEVSQEDAGSHLTLHLGLELASLSFQRMTRQPGVTKSSSLSDEAKKNRLSLVPKETALI